MNLPAGYRIERPTRADVPEILALVHASDIAAVGFPDTDESEVLETLATSWLIRDAQSHPAGWGYLDTPSANAPADGPPEAFCEAYARPGEALAVQATLIDLLLKSITHHATTSRWSHVIAKAGAVPIETDYINLLTTAGFQLQRQQARMTRPLTGAEQRPTPVPGYRLRALRPADLPACHEILRITFADTAHPFQHTLDEFAAVRSGECLVAEAQDGELVGALITTTQSEANDEGWIKWLGVLPAHRGRGLAGALLLTAFAAYAEQGKAHVGLGVDTTNPTGAYRLYESLGMTVAYQVNIYHQPITLPPPSPPT